MSTDYSFEKEIRMEELFDGRLERFGVFEEIIEGYTSPGCRLLRKGCNGLWISGDEVVDVVTSPEENNPVNILSAILQTFDTCVFADDEPQFWGFETQEEWDDYLGEAVREIFGGTSKGRHSDKGES
jgi:hypothetical protein